VPDKIIVFSFDGHTLAMMLPEKETQLGARKKEEQCKCSLLQQRYSFLAYPRKPAPDTVETPTWLGPRIEVLCNSARGEMHITISNDVPC
jgi:hypothetical protein